MGSRFESGQISHRCACSKVGESVIRTDWIGSIPITPVHENIQKNEFSGTSALVTYPADEYRREGRMER